MRLRRTPLVSRPPLTYSLSILAVAILMVSGDAVRGPATTGPADGAARDPADRWTTGTRLGAVDYAVPATALHVSVTGRDESRGTAELPLRTFTEAVRRARTGSTVVVHAGTYHEEVTIPEGKGITIQAAPRAVVWLDGSRLVGGWRAEGDSFVSTGWKARFDPSPTYTWGAPDGTRSGWAFLDPRHPMAAHPDQVWVDGRRQRQVAARADVVPGAFYVDYSTDRLYLGTNPAGKEVRGSDIAKAISIRARGTTVRGIGVRRFAPSVPNMGAVTAEASRITLDNVVIRDNATTGLHVVGSGVSLRHVTVAANGMLGLSATYADGLRVDGLLAEHNNTEGFNMSPVAGGAKIGRTRGVSVRHSVFRRNAGTGLWFDESTYDGEVLDSSSLANEGHGLSLEISAKFLVADALVADNDGYGIKVNNTSDVSLWNNTVVGNDRPINIVQDERSADVRSASGHDPRQAFPDPTMSWLNGPVRVHNNIMGQSRGSANCLLCVEDYSGRRTAKQMRVSLSGNVYQRRTSSSPAWMVVWSRGHRDPEVFSTVAAFQAATGWEFAHLELTGEPAVGTAWKASDDVTERSSSVALPLPADVAHQLGRPPGVRHLGAWIG